MFALVVVIGIISIFVACAFAQVHHSTTLCKRGYVYLKTGELDKAALNFAEAIRYNKLNYSAHEGLGIALYDQNHFREAILAYTIAIHLNPKHDIDYYNRALAFVREDNFGMAIKDYSQVIQINSTNCNYYVDRASAYLGANRDDEAIEDCNVVIGLNKTSSEAYYYRGLAYFKQYHYNKAISDYTSAISLNSDDGHIYRDRGAGYYYTGDWSKATNDFERAIRANPTDGLAYNEYAWLLATCPDSMFRNGSKAVDLSLKASDLSGWKLWISLDTLAAAYAEAGDFTKAVKYQTQVVGMNGMSETDYTNANHRLNLYMQHKSYQETPQP